MKIIKDVEDFNTRESSGLFLTIGNFDGLHLGHRNFIANIIDCAKKNNAKVLVVSFRPHPSVILANQSNFLINSYEDKIELLESFGVDYFFEIAFSRDFSTLSGKEFLKNYITAFKRLERVYVGHDFAFGANKEGGKELMEEYFSHSNIEVILSEEYRDHGNIISSTEIRKMLNLGNVSRVESLLGRTFYLRGPVVKGKGRGRQIGFPTANIQIEKDRLIPQNGVYKSMVEFKNAFYKSVTNIGLNPTFEGNKTISVESHILDFDQDIYGENLKVHFCKKFRDEMKFETVNDLIEQIRKDVEKRREE